MVTRTMDEKPKTAPDGREQYKVTTNVHCEFNTKDAVTNALDYIKTSCPDTGTPQVKSVKIDVSWRHVRDEATVTTNVKAEFNNANDTSSYLKRNVPDGHTSQPTVLFVILDMAWENLEWPSLEK